MIQHPADPVSLLPSHRLLIRAQEDEGKLGRLVETAASARHGAMAGSRYVSRVRIVRWAVHAPMREARCCRNSESIRTRSRCLPSPAWLTDDVERTLPGLKIVCSVSKAPHEPPCPTTDRSHHSRRKRPLIPALTQLHPCPDLAAVLTIRHLVKVV
jgi:hypothetical protein